MSGEISEDWNECKEFKANIRKVLAYQVPGADFSPKYKEGKWDGYISLYDWKTVSFPTGVLSLVVNYLKEQEIPYKLINKRIKPEKNCKLKANLKKHNKELYFYQKGAVEKALAAGRGVISIATGGGKTLIASELIAQISTVPFLFYVPSISLLRQTHREFVKYLEQNGHPPHVGFIGANICDINFKGINVITYQTALSAFNEVFKESSNTIEHSDVAGEAVKKTLDELKSINTANLRAYKKAAKSLEIQHEKLKLSDPKKYNSAISRGLAKYKTALDKSKSALEIRLTSIKNKQNVQKLIENAKGFIVDEAHVAAVIVEALGQHAENAYWRIGLSATPFREDNQEIRIQGTMGKKLIEISASDLIDLGFLVKPTIYMVKINHYEKTRDYHEIYDKHITHCWERNYRIKQFAEAFKAAGRPVLIFVEKIEHGVVLEKMINDAVFIAGKDRGEDDPDAAERDYRRRMLNETEANNVILIATQWAYVGIDAPLISTLILAGSSKSAISTYQCIGRVLRIAPGKEDAVIIDFMDREPDLHNHSLNRKRVYSKERSWVCKIVKLPEIKEDKNNQD